MSALLDNGESPKWTQQEQHKIRSELSTCHESHHYITFMLSSSLETTVFTDFNLVRFEHFGLVCQVLSEAVCLQYTVHKSGLAPKAQILSYTVL